MKKCLRLVVFVLLGMSAWGPAYAKTVDLMQVYKDALAHDPTYRNAIATYRDKREALPQAQAQLLPLIATETTSQRYFKRTRHHSSATASNYDVNRFHYNETVFGASLDQPLFNFAYWSQLSGAKAAVKSAYADLQDAKQSLITRVAAAYFNVLLAQDTLRFTLAEKRAVKQQLEQTRQRFRVGLDAITSVYEAQASYDSITAQAIQAQNGVENSFEQLRQLTGIHYNKLASFKANLPLVTPNPSSVEQWVSSVLKDNFSLNSARALANYYRENIKQQFAGHLPTLDAIGSVAYTTTSDPSKAASGAGGKVAALGLELKFPIFSGGAVTSLTRQANAQYQEAYTTMEQTERQMVSSTRQTYNDVIAGISTIKADKQAIKSQYSSLKGTIAAFKVGTRTIVEVLDAQKSLTEVQKQYANDQYTYINNTLSLKQLAGMLCPQDLAEINTWLLTTQTKPAKTVANKATLKPQLKSPLRKPTVSHKPHKLFRLQLGSFVSKAHAKAFIQHHQLSAKADIQMASSHDKSHTYYRVVYGHYAAYGQAREAMQQLPAAVKANSPWVITTYE